MEHIVAWIVVFVIMVLAFLVAKRLFKLSIRLIAWTIIAIFALGAVIVYLVIF